MPKLKVRTESVIDVDEWDRIVIKTYGRPYNFQQQDGCKDRGTFYITTPDKSEDYENDSIPEEVNHEARGVSFKAWLERDPKQKLSNLDEQEDYCLLLWWQRNFYPNVQMVANDLCEKGVLEAGKYIIEIDW